MKHLEENFIFTLKHFQTMFCCILKHIQANLEKPSSRCLCHLETLSTGKILISLYQESMAFTQSLLSPSLLAAGAWIPSWPENCLYMTTDEVVFSRVNFLILLFRYSNPLGVTQQWVDLFFICVEGANLYLQNICCAWNIIKFNFRLFFLTHFFCFLFTSRLDYSS